MLKKHIEKRAKFISRYAKIWGETKFQPREFPRSGSKAIDVEKEKKSENQ